jgi:hypothetical protein
LDAIIKKWFKKYRPGLDASSGVTGSSFNDPIFNIPQNPQFDDIDDLGGISRNDSADKRSYFKRTTRKSSNDRGKLYQQHCHPDMPRRAPESMYSTLSPASSLRSDEMVAIRGQSFGQRPPLEPTISGLSRVSGSGPMSNQADHFEMVDLPPLLQ